MSNPVNSNSQTLPLYAVFNRETLPLYAVFSFPSAGEKGGRPPAIVPDTLKNLVSTNPIQVKMPVRREKVLLEEKYQKRLSRKTEKAVQRSLKEVKKVISKDLTLERLYALEIIFQENSRSLSFIEGLKILSQDVDDRLKLYDVLVRSCKSQILEFLQKTFLEILPEILEEEEFETICSCLKALFPNLQNSNEFCNENSKGLCIKILEKILALRPSDANIQAKLDQLKRVALQQKLEPLKEKVLKFSQFYENNADSEKKQDLAIKSLEIAIYYHQEIQKLAPNNSLLNDSFKTLKTLEIKHKSIRYSEFYYNNIDNEEKHDLAMKSLDVAIAYYKQWQKLEPQNGDVSEELTRLCELQSASYEASNIGSQ